MTTTYTRFDSPLGQMLATSEADALTGLYFTGQRYFPTAAEDWREDSDASPFPALRRQLDEYFAGTRLEFDLPLDPKGGRCTPFQRAVWNAIAAVPLGATTSYQSLALTCGRPTASRASGAATGRNPLSIIVPCHRIVGSNGTLTGYAGGLDRKKALLAFERAVAAGDARASGVLAEAWQTARTATTTGRQQMAVASS